MHLSEILHKELTAFARKNKSRKLDIIETGTIRGEGDEYRQNDGWSTLTFAEYVKDSGGSLISIDLDVSVADKVLRAKSLRGLVNLRRGHSIDVLAEFATEALADGGASFDIAFLDSDNDGALIFHEYLIVRRLMRKRGLIIVDDVDIQSTEVVKGHEILPWARTNDIPHRIIERGDENYRTGVLVFEV